MCYCSCFLDLVFTKYSRALTFLATCKSNQNPINTENCNRKGHNSSLGLFTLCAVERLGQLSKGLFSNLYQ